LTEKKTFDISFMHLFVTLATIYKKALHISFDNCIIRRNYSREWGALLMFVVSLSETGIALATLFRLNSIRRTDLPGNF